MIDNKAGFTVDETAIAFLADPLRYRDLHPIECIDVGTDTIGVLNEPARQLAVAHPAAVMDHLGQLAFVDRPGNARIAPIAAALGDRSSHRLRGAHLLARRLDLFERQRK